MAAILIVAATAAEIPALASGPHGRHQLDVLITGVGMVPTAAQCARALATGRYDLAYNFGVCGSFDPALPPGTVVHVVRDEVAELGVEDGERFLTLAQLGLLDGDGALVNPHPPAHPALAALPRVRGITVNTVHGDDASIARVRARLDPQVESMEGAAFAYACRMMDVPYAQVRAVSNVVERRNRAAWRLAEAVERLGATVHQLLA